jgi:hypothetical protein
LKIFEKNTATQDSCAHLSTSEANAVGSQVQGQPGLPSEILSPERKGREGGREKRKERRKEGRKEGRKGIAFILNKYRLFLSLFL